MSSTETLFTTEEKVLAHEAAMRSRREDLEARRPIFEACCDPKVAASYEIRKPHFRWTVQANWNVPTGNGLEAVNKSSADIVAQNEDDAWAMFCDSIRMWPSRKSAKVVFSKGEQVPADVLAAIAVSPAFRY